MADVSKFVVTQETRLREVILAIDRGAKGVALVVDEEQRLVATLTDGDMRRAILAGHDLQSSVTDLLSVLRVKGRMDPITAHAGTSRGEVLRLMSEHSIRHVPVIDGANRVQELATLEELTVNPKSPLRAVVMAGGFGKRLLPLTAETPKPMLKVGDRPLMEHVLAKLREAGIRQVKISTHYHAEKISSHFGNGEAYGIDLEYIRENVPLGTAGALSLMQGDDPLLVINGDILTNVDFCAMRDFHDEYHAEMTVAVRQYCLDVPYGMVECEGMYITGLKEKPTLKILVNAGIYLLSPAARHFIPSGERFDMTQLVERLLDARRTVVSFPIWEYWIDIGRQEDFEQAQFDVARQPTKS
jgi:dTDP-glucose pyrophosphorylase